MVEYGKDIHIHSLCKYGEVRSTPLFPAAMTGPILLIQIRPLF